jgi:hypothetical protein
MTRETQRQLYEAVRAHTLDLEMTRSISSGLDPKVLNRRIGAVLLLLEWLSTALELGPPASPAIQTPPPSSAPADRDQIPPSAPDPPKNSRQ